MRVRPMSNSDLKKTLALLHMKAAAVSRSVEDKSTGKPSIRH